MRNRILNALVASVFLLTGTSFAEEKRWCKKVGSNLLRAGAVTGDKLELGTVQPDDIKDGAINSEVLTDFVAVPGFVLAVGSTRDIYNDGEIRLEAKCENNGTQDLAKVIVWNTTDGAIVQGYYDNKNITAASTESQRLLHYVYGNTGLATLEPARRFHVVAADGSIINSKLFVALNVRSLPGCHFGGFLQVTSAS